ncbi:MAG: ParA family protein [Pseudomonadota bacterium]
MRTVLVANRKGGCGKTVTAITLAGALAATGARVALADADRQKSALRWLKRRPATARPIEPVDWTKKGAFGTAPKKTDWLVIDAPGAVTGEAAQTLIAEARALIVPVQPSVFDEDSTSRFLRDIEEIKRVRKGKTGIHLLANRVRSGARAEAALASFFARLGAAPVAWIAERAAYAGLAEAGLSVFDVARKPERALQAQWHPLLDRLGDG